MRDEVILSGRTVRFLNTEAPSELPPAYDIVRGIETNYKFVEAPREMSSIDFSKGVRFRGGSFDNTPIELLEIYNDGMMCEALTHTHYCDKVVENVIEWLRLNLNFNFSEKDDRPRYYLSLIEFGSDAPLLAGTPQMNFAAEKLSEKLCGDGGQPPYQTFGFELQQDPQGFGGLALPRFSLERRSERPIEDGFYFSSAPLSTEDHLHLLKDMEAVASA